MLLCELFQNKTLSPEFYAWFGDSKAVNVDGSPMILYHGTSKDQDFKHFSIPKSGTWFATTPKGASDYAVENDSQNLVYDHGTGKFIHKHTASRVIPVYLKINNPKVYEGYPQQEIGHTQNYKKAAGIFFDKLRSEGYDSMIITHHGKPSVVALLVNDPSRIKSAISNKDYTHKKNIHEKASPASAIVKAVLKNPKFKQWFGKSKIVDHHGLPLVVYHGTASAFEAFEVASIGKVFSDDKHGFFFTNNTGEDMASGYAKNAAIKYKNDNFDDVEYHGANVIPAFVKIENPYTWEDYMFAYDYDQPTDEKDYERKISYIMDGMSMIGWFDENKYAIVQQALDEGHDGIFLFDPTTDITFGKGNPTPENIVVAFRPDQIKSVFAKEFAPSDKLSELRKSLRGDLRESDDSNVLYHVTPSKNVPSIMTHGLMPRVGRRSRKLGETPAIYFFPNIEAIDNALMNWLGNEFSENTRLALLQVSIPPNVDIKSDAGFERHITMPVTPDRIKVLTKNLGAVHDLNSLTEDSDVRYQNDGVFHDPDNKVVRDKGAWGASHSNSFAITGKSAAIMGADGYKDTGYIPAKTLAIKKLKAIVQSAGSKEPLYHGFQNRKRVKWEIGKVLTIPLTATSGDLQRSAGYGTSWTRGRIDSKGNIDDNEGLITVFEFPKGTKICGYSKWAKEDAEDFGHLWSEAIVAGKFRIISVRQVKYDGTWRNDVFLTVVRLEPVEYFNPETGKWFPANTKLKESESNHNLADRIRSRTYYHGTARNNLAFTPGRPAYFTTDLASAEKLAKMDAEVDAGKPFVLCAKLHITSPVILDTYLMQDLHCMPEEVAKLKAQGHDCAVGEFDPDDEMCVLDSDKIEIIKIVKQKNEFGLTESIEIVHDRFRNESDDDYVYHITLEPLAQRIMQQGFMPNRRPTMTNYSGYSKGKVFFTERSGVSFWEERVEQHAENNMDDPPPVAVLRVPKEEIGSLLQPDPVGTRDSHASCYFITEPFKPTN